MSDDVTATCDLCGRLIVPRQKRCACGAIVRQEAPSDPEAAARFDFGALLPWVPLAGVALLLVWMVNPGSLVYTSTPLWKLYGVTAIASAMFVVLAAERARRLGWDYSELELPGLPGLSGLTPVSWFVAVLAAWPVALPAFLYVHYRASKRLRMAAGSMAVVAFTCLFGYVLLNVTGQAVEWESGAAAEKPVPAKYAQLKSPGQARPAGGAPFQPTTAAPPASALADTAAPMASATPQPRYLPPAPPPSHQVAPIFPDARPPQQQAHGSNRGSSGGSSSAGQQGIAILKRPE